MNGQNRKSIDDIINASDIAELLSDSLQIRKSRGYVSEFEDRPFIYEDYLKEARGQGKRIKDDDDARIDYIYLEYKALLKKKKWRVI